MGQESLSASPPSYPAAPVEAFLPYDQFCPEAEQLDTRVWQLYM